MPDSQASAEERWAPTNSGDPRWLLVRRVCASSEFQRSPRQRELLTYLSYVAIEEPARAPVEHQVGIAVFGRQPGYDTGSDTIVRVQASQLRKKLQSYMLTEGQGDSLVIDLPKGSYHPVFRPKEAEPPARIGVPEEPVAAKVAATPTRSLVILAAALLAACGVCAWLYNQNRVLRSAVPAQTGRTPALDTLWRGLYTPGQQVMVVGSDANALILADLLGKTITLSDYRYYIYPRQLTVSIPDPEVRVIAEKITGTFLTPIQDAAAFGAVSYLAARYGFKVSLIHARDFRLMPESHDGLILLGHTKGNPWGELFQDRMNFRYKLAAPGLPASIVNTRPQPGEQSEYQLRSGHEGYSVVAHQPNPSGHGSALLLFGTDMSSLDAATRMVSDESVLEGVLRRLNMSTGSRLPHFEVVARTRLLGSGTPSFDVIAHRVRPR